MYQESFSFNHIYISLSCHCHALSCIFDCVPIFVLVLLVTKFPYFKEIKIEVVNILLIEHFLFKTPRNYYFVSRLF